MSMGGTIGRVVGLFAASRDQGEQGHGEGTAHTDDGTAGRQDRDSGLGALRGGVR